MTGHQHNQALLSSAGVMMAADLLAFIHTSDGAAPDWSRTAGYA